MRLSQQREGTFCCIELACRNGRPLALLWDAAVAAEAAGTVTVAAATAGAGPTSPKKHKQVQLKGWQGPEAYKRVAAPPAQGRAAPNPQGSRYSNVDDTGGSPAGTARLEQGGQVEGFCKQR